jgi:hypothetical protein
MKSYAGIGSRDTPPSMLNHMQKLATRLREQGYVLYSGGAAGADSAFEAGAGEAKKIFLPRDGFNGRRVDGEKFFLYSPAAVEVAKTVHPVWDKLIQSHRDFHSRNVHQVLGEDLESPVDFVLYWSEGDVKGGTSTAVNLARRLLIPTFNLRTTTFNGVLTCF